MQRWLYRYRTVSGDPGELAGRLRGELRGLLAAGTSSTPPAAGGDGAFLVQLPAYVLGTELTKAVRVTTGVAATHGSRVVIPVTWQAHPARHAFPTFDGTIEVEPLGRAVAQLTVVGAYRVPAGAIGLLADSTVLGGVAERTADRLLDGLARALAQTGAREQLPAVTPSTTPLAPMRVADVMTPDPVLLDAEQPLRTAALLLFHSDISGAPVVDADGALIGVLSEADLIDKQARPRSGLGRGVSQARRRRSAVTVGQACSRPARVTAADATLRDAAREMLDHDIARLVVVHRSRIAGIVTRHDVLQALIRTDEAIRHAVDAVLHGQEEPDVTAAVEWGVVTLAGTATRLSRIRRLVAYTEAIDGVMQVDADHLHFREDDVTPVPMPLA